MAGIPGILVAWVPSGAQVITVRGSLEPPVIPGSTPHPVRSEAPAAVVRARRKEVERRAPVMGMHISASCVTWRWPSLNAG
ncbi:hypothetical protein GCM10009612_04050 [Streptomyces beijiangensis]